MDSALALPLSTLFVILLVATIQLPSPDAWDGRPLFDDLEQWRPNLLHLEVVDGTSMSPQLFFDQYWEQRPVILRGASSNTNARFFRSLAKVHLLSYAVALAVSRAFHGLYASTGCSGTTAT